MALVGYEGLVIAAMLVVLFFWGPQKLPEMAKSIGQAKREFEKAAKEVSTLATTPTTPTATTESATEAPIIVAAKSLGIVTEGKTKEQLATEIVAKTAK